MPVLAGIVTHRSNVLDQDMISEKLKAMCAVQIGQKDIAHIDVHQYKNVSLAFGVKKAEAEIRVLPQHIYISNDKAITVLFNGTVFQSDCQRYPENDSSDLVLSDEVICRLYQQYGVDAFNHIHAEFVAVLYDRLRERLLLIRDKLGKRSLYYYADKNFFIFASEIRGILRTGLTPKNINVTSVGHFLIDKGFLQPETPICDIYSLLPGEYIEIAQDKFIKKRYAGNVFYYDRNDTRSIDEISHDIKKRFIDAVLQRLYRQNRVGILYSGGVDSTLILAILRQQDDLEIITSSIGFRNKDYCDDVDYAQTTTKNLGIANTCTFLTPYDIQKNILKIIWHQSMPVSGSFQVYFASKALCDHGIHLGFAGFGTEAYLGYDYNIQYFYRLSKMLSLFYYLPTQLRLTLFSFLRKSLFCFNWNQSDYVLIKKFFDFERGVIDFECNTLTEDLIRRIVRVDKFDIFIRDYYLSVFQQAPSKNFIDRFFFMRFNSYEQNHVNLPMPGVALANNVILQTPMMDFDLIGAVNKVPLKYLNHGNIYRYFEERILREFIDYERKKSAFAMPFKTWLKNDLWYLIEKLYSQNSVESRGIFDYPRLMMLFDDFKNNPHSGRSWQDIWCFVVIELWFRLFIDNDFDTFESMPPLNELIES